MPHSWEGNRRSCVTLTMRHELSGLSTYGLNSCKWEMSTPPTPQLGYGTFTFTLSLQAMRIHKHTMEHKI